MASMVREVALVTSGCCVTHILIYTYNIIHTYNTIIYNIICVYVYVYIYIYIYIYIYSKMYSKAVYARQHFRSSGMWCLIKIGFTKNNTLIYHNIW